jgi:hypothetical protein
LRLVCALVETVNFGLKTRLLQPPTANGLDTLAVAPSAPEIVAETCCAAQLVGLNMKSGRSMSTVTRLRRIGTPKTTCGIAYGPPSSVVTVRVESVGFTSIRARTTLTPRLKGPATTGTTMLKPNGAPSWGPVR